jgi:hypothetical protein
MPLVTKITVLFSSKCLAGPKNLPSPFASLGADFFMPIQRHSEQRVAQFAQQAVCEAQETPKQLSLSKLTHNHENVTGRAKLPLSQ